MSPRIFGIPAVRAPVVAVLWRGPSDWSHLERWDVAAGWFEPGAWIRANLYPQRCDLSPDGHWFCHFTLKRSRPPWKAGGTYVALSRLPWLTALAAWGTCGTWTRGAPFVGRLLVATTAGTLQIRDWLDGATAVRSEVDVAALTPAPSPPPARASEW